ncbi:MAG: mannose-1-phosphate guanylyltransferase/mannose-6-phosphate isomerase [Desulfobacterales bacterium]|jgi:mannose-1-phosphate guanylyltransferase/mannose-6-phosphate isomerase
MKDLDLTVYPVLLAGGMGTRLWPVSRVLFPKQLVKFIGEYSLLQETIKRLSPVLDIENVKVVCGQQHLYDTARQIENLGLKPEDKLICEPSGRNTAPAILLAVLHLLAHEKDAVLCIFPADHVIQNLDGFHDRLKAAIKLASDGYIVTFGIQPHYPETGYGYVEGETKMSQGAQKLKRFVEKPDLSTAEKYIKAGNFFWNSGMFAFKASVILSEFETYQPELLAKMKTIFTIDKPIARKDYDQLTDISIDYAIMEKTEKGVVLPSDIGWSDIGSWKSLHDFLEKDADGNVANGDVIMQDTHNCLILGHDRLIAANRLRDIAVVETADAVFVSDLEHSREVKSIVSKLKDEGRGEWHKHPSVYHPWGILKLLEQTDNYTTNELTVYPGSSMSLPANKNTAYHFFVVKGQAAIRAGSDRKILKSRESFTYTAEERVQVENTEENELSLIQLELKNTAKVS